MKTNLPTLILCGAIAALYPATLRSNAVISTPVPAFGDGYDDTACPALNIADIQEFTSHDNARIVGNIAKSLARSTPYTDIMSGGNIPANMSATMRSVVQERAVLNQSMTRPKFVPMVEMCGEVGEAAEVGTTEYTYFLAGNRGMGPLVCLHQMRNEFEGSYLAAESALRKQIVELVNADSRGVLVDRSGSKLVVRKNDSFSQMYSGDSQAIDTPFDFGRGLPNAPVNFALLEDLSSFLREALLVEGFEGDSNEPLLKFIGSQEINRQLRNEAGIREDHRYLAAGRYDLGKDNLTRYRWEGPYRGYAFGVDSVPLRFNEVDANGDPIYLEPEIPKKVTRNVGGRFSGAYLRAKYEVALVVGADSFARLTPAVYTGEGSFKFPSQVTMGELKFKVIEDNCRNAWGDFGRHFYQIQRAIKPMRPHAVCAIAYKRAQSSYGLIEVPDYADYSSQSDAL